MKLSLQNKLFKLLPQHIAQREIALARVPHQMFQLHCPLVEANKVAKPHPAPDTPRTSLVAFFTIPNLVLFLFFWPDQLL